MLSRKDMTPKDSVQHEGVVKSISAQTIEVLIINHSACAGCHAKGSCGMADMKQKIITAQRPEGNIQVGDPVTVYATLHNAAYSVVLAYVMPSTLIIASIFFLEKSGSSELYAAITSLVLLLGYFFILYLFRNKISKKIKFTVRKNGNY